MSKEKVTLSPSEITEKWKTRMKGAIPDIVRGVERVTASPMEKAAEKGDKMKANLVASIDNGTWGKRLRAVSLADWKTKTAAKVQERMSGGVEAATGKHEKFAGWLVNRVNTGLAKIKGMPDMTLEDSVARVRTMMTTMAEKPFKSE